MSTFFGLNIAASGLKTYQAAANTTSNNISNVATKGYSKQVTNTKANNALRSYTDYGTLSTGVSAESITQIRSEYYDNKYWQYSSAQGEYTQKVEYMDQLQNFLKDDSTVDGFSTIYANFFNDLDTLAHSANDTTKRNQVISDARNLCNYFNSVSNGLSEMQTSINSEIKTTVEEINSISRKISLLNDQINDVEIAGSYANDLRDQRALLIDELSNLCSVEVKETKILNSNDPDVYIGGTNFQVKINGIELVDGDRYRELKCVARENKINQSDAEGLYDIKWADTDVPFSVTSSVSSGTLKGLMEMRDGNNHENFSGTIEKIQGRTITIKNPTITDMDALTMPSEGIIVLGDKEYTYGSYGQAPGFTMKTDELGNTTFTFTITGSTSGLASVVGRPAHIGESIDFKGIPYYQAQMNEFLRAFSREFNTIQESGVDLYGNNMTSFFVTDNAAGTQLTFANDKDTIFKSTSDSYYQLTAGNIKINRQSLEDPSIFATSKKEDFEQGVDSYELVTSLKALQSDKILYRGSGGQTFLQYIISDATVDAEESELLKNNYDNIVATVKNQRTSVSGVDEDEEALDLVKFRNAYNLCSKVVQIMSEMYDRLITSTGV